VDVAEYCREIERYLCRKNEGHLVRVVGPVFELVSGWATQGVPLAVAFKGIDQYCERYYAKGPRRRPVRVEFCEGDVLELFDAWRRAVGVSSVEGAEEPSERKHDSLPSHIDRAMSRLTALRAGGRSAVMAARLDETVRELDRLKASAKSARGEARMAILDRLATLDSALLDAVRSELSDSARATAGESGVGDRAVRRPDAGRRARGGNRRGVHAAAARDFRASRSIVVLRVVKAPLALPPSTFYLLPSVTTRATRRSD
jgi:hypothetical protein